jgi:hypothetical protein
MPEYVVSELGMLIGRSIMFIMAFSFYYKRTILWTALQGLMIGAFASVNLVAAIETIRKSSVATIELGDVSGVIAFIFGLLYFSILIPQLRYLFRIVSAMTLAVTIGTNEPQVVYSAYATIVGYAENFTKSPSYALVFILFMCALLYFVFAKKMEGPLRIPRIIGVYTIYTFSALMMAPDFYFFTDKLTAFMATVALSPAVLVLVAAFVVILIDIARVRLMKPVEVKAE